MEGTSGLLMTSFPAMASLGLKREHLAALAEQGTLRRGLRPEQAILQAALSHRLEATGPLRRKRS